ncbi:FKBP-type peptidyl-prolyl cis-trans isomerase N-terminal domain-containing protein [Pseudofrancisella aestuarii]|uniref:Peptidyl-prolyl cis-trans isomerase n=1 Tax=Pseudofrancisella aestuarii TaxID=2670347 RepID=A0ABV9TDB1_9GAMM|nr:FKBP-type peptidyl-prolyl cis-trans isomerase N-terminal domain-containing protein [Pseudofrancisella aestuarii]
MKISTRLLTTLILSSIGISAFAANNTAQASKESSYSWGYDIGAGMARQSLDMDDDSIIAGYSDALNNKKPRLSRDQIVENLTELKKKIRSGQISLPEENLKYSTEFMEQIAKIDNIIKVDDGVYYQMIKQGDGKKPKSNNKITLDYQGTTPVITYEKNKLVLNDIKEGKLVGITFDSNKDITFPLQNLIKCWKDAIPKIPTGSTFILYCAPDVAYGEKAPVAIGPNQALSFKITLKSFK